MNKHVFLAITTVLVLASCSKETDVYDATASKDFATEDMISANVEKVFGTTFDPNHDWCTTTSGEVSIQADATVKKVQVLVNVCEIDDPSTPSYVTRNTMKVLNEVETNGQTFIKLNYDAPKDNLGLYVAFSTDHGRVFKKVVGNSVSFNDGAQAPAMTRALPTGYTLPSGEFVIDTIETSYANQRGWIPGELLYGFKDYTAQKMASSDYSDEFKVLFRSVVFSYFPNGREHNNLPVVMQSGYYNAAVYPITTGDEPIIVTPAYKCDNPLKYGNEVYNSDLYYYYFKEENVGSDPVAYFQSLPKYKAIPFNNCFGVAEDDSIAKHGSFALMYFGDGTPTIGTKGSYEFPAGYKIGFMIRAKTTADQGKKQGEVYGDGRLNNKINSFGNFASSHLGEDGPRVAWLTLNDKIFMSWESGTDADFNDVIMEVEGGIEPFDDIPDLESEVYTYCFEDTKLGDYDMNDVVIKAIRKNKTTVEYSVVACGANDQLFIRNINCGVINDDVEVHSLFGKSPSEFINTTGGVTCDPVTVTKTVDESFSFLNPYQQPYIYDKTTNTTIYLSKKGQDPHGIMIPDDFQYPLERICVKDAYPQFNNWGENSITSTRWYEAPTKARVFSW
jgi:hypothetical protein